MLENSSEIKLLEPVKAENKLTQKSFLGGIDLGETKYEFQKRILLQIKNKNRNQAILNLVILFINIFNSGFIVNVLTIVQPDITFVYSYEPKMIIWTSSFQLISGIILCIISPLILEYISLRNAVLLTGFLDLLGSLFLLFIPFNFQMTYIGFILNGIAASIILSTIIKFCNIWFDKEERAVFTGFLGLATLIGTGVIAFIPYIFIPYQTINEGNL